MWVMTRVEMPGPVGKMPSPAGTAENGFSFQPSLRDSFALPPNPGVKTPGYFRSVAPRQEISPAHFPHVHGVHAGGTDGLHAQIGVFVGTAEFRVNADAPRRFQKNVRRRFLVLYHFAGDDSGEQMADF